jgi:hypothetical protein
VILIPVGFSADLKLKETRKELNEVVFIKKWGYPII